MLRLDLCSFRQVPIAGSNTPVPSKACHIQPWHDRHDCMSADCIKQEAETIWIHIIHTWSMYLNGTDGPSRRCMVPGKVYDLSRRRDPPYFRMTLHASMTDDQSMEEGS